MGTFDDILTGLDELPWSDMRHAYGPANEVPGILRNLIDPDYDTREHALDSMYGGVHHQGDVYDSTVASIPFLLRIAVTAGLPGRADVVELLGSIGGAEEDYDGYDYGSAADGLHFAEAHRLVAEAYATWVSLLSDVDPAVRAAAARVLPACRGEVSQSLDALIRAAVEETDSAARMAYIGVIGRLGRMGAAAAAGEYLSGVLTGDPVLAARLAALAEVTRLGEPVPADQAVELLSRVYASAGGLEPERLAADVIDSFGDRVDARRSVVSQLLRSENWESRLHALYPTLRLIDGWRGDYGQILGLTGDQLGDPHEALRPRALRLLKHAGPLAAPAADAVAAVLAENPREAAMVRWADETAVGDPVIILAELRDPRVVPVLGWLVDHDDMPHNVPFLIHSLGAIAAPLLPLVRSKAGRLADDDKRKYGVVRAMHGLGAPDGEVVDLLLALPDSAVIVNFLGEIGATAAQPRLRDWLRADNQGLAGSAAKAIARIGGDPDPVFDYVDRWAATDVWALRDALMALVFLGPAARPRIGIAVSAMDAEDQSMWTPVRGAEAVWRATGDADAVLPVLRKAWTRNIHTRRHIATLCRDMGESGRPLHDLVEAELATVHRYNARLDTWSDTSVREDEEVQRLCRSVLGR